MGIYENIIDLNAVRQAKSEAIRHQEYINALGESLKDLFENEYSTASTSPFDVPMEIKHKDITLQIINWDSHNHPVNKYIMAYQGAIEVDGEEVITVMIQYYRASVFKSISILAEGKTEEDEDLYYQHISSNKFIATKLMEIMINELNVGIIE